MQSVRCVATPITFFLVLAGASPAYADDTGSDVGFRNRTVSAETWSNGARNESGEKGSRQQPRRQSGPAGANARPATSPDGIPYVTGFACTSGCAASNEAPQVVAQRAIARLRLLAPTPSVGPPPSINRWKMAAVGYPLWLWVDGTTDPVPVTDSDGPLSVSLDARITSITFTMGDGHTVSCAGTGTRWTKAVAAGKPSPTCGYTYTKPSLPKGNYTVTATTHWAVDWNINGTTGTLPYVQNATTTVPVGELQVLVR